jgi:hypothetical protein
MRERFVAARAAIAAHRWRWRLLAWSSFAAVAALHPYTPDEGRGYLVGMLVLGMLCGAIAPRPFVTAGFGLYIATVIRVFTIESGADPYVSIEIVAGPLFVALARAVVWAVVDRPTRHRHGQLDLEAAGSPY